MDSVGTKAKFRFASLVRPAFEAPRVGLTEPISWYSAVGLSLLYSSAYFLQPLSATGAYLLPSHDLLRLIGLPTLVAAVIGTAVVYGVTEAVRRWCTPTVAGLGAIMALSMLTLIGLKGVMAAAGYDWLDRIVLGSDLVASVRRLKIIASLAALALVWTMRNALPKVSRLLSSLGFAFLALAGARIATLSHGVQATPVQSNVTVESEIQSTLTAAEHRSDDKSASAADRPKRVIWIIFDETDFSRLYGDQRVPDLDPKNFDRLARLAVFATKANAPASATMYSIPALLTGTPIRGEGVQIDKSAILSLERLDRKWITFGEATSIFGALAAEGLGASALGFYHPCCKLFELRRCDSFEWPGAHGDLDSALWANIPDSVVAKIRGVDSMEAISRDSLTLLSQYLVRDDAFTFVHLNIPHLPATYADKILHLPFSSDPLIEYSHNLMLADRVLGEVMDSAEKQLARHDMLLVVSTDHWFRNAWYQADVPEVSRIIPFIVWKVGESDGIVLSQPLSTVNTAAMILDFLNGRLSTQSDIADWWVDQPVYPSFIVPTS